MNPMFLCPLYLLLLLSPFPTTHASLTPKTTEAAKLVLIGAMGSGKSCLFRALNRQPFDSHLPSTIGVDLQKITIPSRKHLCHVGVAVWDTAGQEQYQAMVPLYSRGADIVLAVFDVSECGGIEEVVARWGELPEMRRDRTCKVILVGTKYDLLSTGNDSSEQLEQRVNYFATKCGYDGGIVVSSKSAFNIGPLLGMIGDFAGDALRKNRRPVTVVVESKPAGDEKPFSCC